MNTIRSFIAIDLPEPVRQLLDEFGRELSQNLAGGIVRWVPSSNIHLTLRFLGDTPTERVPEVNSALDAVAAKHRPFSLHVERLGCFPNPRQPRVIWIGVSGSEDQLQTLQQAVEAAVRPLGWEPEGRPFHPHLTLGRVKDSRALVEARLPWGRPVEPLEIPVESVDLIESRLLPSGAVYSTLHTSPLQGEEP